MSFGEMVILGVIALVVVGPRRLPSMLRTAGQLIGKVRRMAMDIRAESGIDEILDAEGIRSEIDNFRRLATGELVLDEPKRTILPDREREYPRVGPDAYGALSEDIVPYSPSPAVEALPAPTEDTAPSVGNALPAATQETGPPVGNALPAPTEDTGPSVGGANGLVATDASDGSMAPAKADDSALAPAGAGGVAPTVEVKN
jgi:sec-independent protein translocase protein TatB